MVGWRRKLPSADLVVVAGYVLALRDDGSSFAAGTALRSFAVGMQARVWAHDATGAPLWTWSDDAVRGGIDDMRMQGDRLRLLLSGPTRNQPASAHLLTLDATTGEELDSRKLWDNSSDGTVLTRRARFAHTDTFDSYVYGPDGVTGLDAQGNPIFDGDFAFTIGHSSTIALLGLICHVGERPGFAEPGPSCYLTR